MTEHEPKGIREEIKPLANWDEKKLRHPLLVFWEKVDDRYQLEVQRIGEGSETGRFATLAIFDHEQGNRLLLQERVSLSFGARFGPDVTDVEQWEVRALKFIDEELPNQKPPF